jgi:hypothetical protein
MNVNLYGLTCINKFEVYLQVAIGLGLNNIQKNGFEFESKHKPRHTIDYNAEL